MRRTIVDIASYVKPRYSFVALSLFLSAPLAGSPSQAAPTALKQASATAEDAPSDVTFLSKAPALEELGKQFRATLAWSDSDDGAQMFARIDDGPGEPAFHLNRAYYLRQNGQTFWAFLDLSSMEGRDFQSPAVQFMLQHHVLEVVRPGDHHGDGNQSFVELLSQTKDGAAVYRVVYASLGGARAHQEMMLAYLFYRSPSGAWQVGTHDLAGRLGEGTGKIGWEAISWNTEMKVVWTPGGPAPFRADLKKITAHYQGGEGNIPSYAVSREGGLSGSFPLRLAMSDEFYYEPNSDYTIRTLADTLMAYHSQWMDSDWIASPMEAKRQVEALWIEAIQRLNPGIDADETLTKDRRIKLPDEGDAGRKIYDQLRERLRK